MSIWPSRTKAWNTKTRPVIVNTNGLDKEHNSEEKFKDEENEKDYEELAKQQMGEIIKLNEIIKDRECEIKRLLTKLDENSSFLQKIVLELILIKAQPSAPMVPARTALEEYLAKKNASAAVTGSGPKGKLP